jgi:hypothetical protein
MEEAPDFWQALWRSIQLRTYNMPIKLRIANRLWKCQEPLFHCISIQLKASLGLLRIPLRRKCNMRPRMEYKRVVCRCKFSRIVLTIYNTELELLPYLAKIEKVLISRLYVLCSFTDRVDVRVTRDKEPSFKSESFGKDRILIKGFMPEKLGSTQWSDFRWGQVTAG